jgi:Domain of unknown function (DUF6834), C-terminal domain
MMDRKILAYCTRDLEKMKLTGMDRIGSALRDLLRQHEIIARCELLNRTYQIVQMANLSPSEKEELSKIVGKQIAAGVFSNILSGSPIFFNLPKLDTYTLLNGKIFHFIHTKKYGRQDFDNANRQFQESKSELRSVLLGNLTQLLTDFMTEAGYALAESARMLRFEAAGRKADCFIYATLKDINLENCHPEPGVDCIILVPSKENPGPFIQFFQEVGDHVADSGIQIWVANLEQGTIDPFIGYTTDLDIYNQFKNPRLAQMVRTTWGKMSNLHAEWE